MSKVLPDPNDYAALHGPGALRAEVERQAEAAVLIGQRKFVTAWDLLQKHQMKKRPSIIEGIARERDIINIVAGAKMGKTWFCHALAISVAAGIPFLRPEWECAQGPVILMDNELHEDTIAHRLPFIIDAMGMDRESKESILKNIIVERFRGALSCDKDDDGIDIKKLAPYMVDCKRLKPKLLIFDSFYKTFPEGVSEMDAAAITRVYNTLDKYAEIVQTAAFACVIHSTKGGQGDKGITDVGSGTGAFSRATDNHIVVREHETEGQYVIESASRDQVQQPAVVVRKAFPLYELADGEDPTNLKKPARSNVRPSVTIEQVIEVTRKLKKSQSRDVILAKIKDKTGQGRDAATPAFNEALREGLLTKIEEPNPRGGPKVFYSLDVLAAERWRSEHEKA